MTKYTTTERDNAASKLREMFPIGATVTTVLLHVSRSGMTRDIMVLSPTADNVSRLVARATGLTYNRDKGAIRIGGTGMDMGFSITYSLSRALYGGSGYDSKTHVPFLCIGDRMLGDPRDACPSNDHSNERIINYTRGRLHSDGGYALRHRWL